MSGSRCPSTTWGSSVLYGQPHQFPDGSSARWGAAASARRRQLDVEHAVVTGGDPQGHPEQVREPTGEPDRLRGPDDRPSRARAAEGTPGGRSGVDDQRGVQRCATGASPDRTATGRERRRRTRLLVGSCPRLAYRRFSTVIRPVLRSTRPTRQPEARRVGQHERAVAGGTAAVALGAVHHRARPHVVAATCHGQTRQPSASTVPLLRSAS